MLHDLLPLHEIAKNYRKSPETIRLWITKGILINGERHKLPAMKIGCVWSVSETDLLEFFGLWNSVPKLPQQALTTEQNLTYVA